MAPEKARQQSLRRSNSSWSDPHMLDWLLRSAQFLQNSINTSTLCCSRVRTGFVFLAAAIGVSVVQKHHHRGVACDSLSEGPGCHAGLLRVIHLRWRILRYFCQKDLSCVTAACADWLLLGMQREVKVVIVGNGGVGKTSMIRRFCR